MNMRREVRFVTASWQAPFSRLSRSPVAVTEFRDACKTRGMGLAGVWNPRPLWQAPPHSQEQRPGSGRRKESTTPVAGSAAFTKTKARVWQAQRIHDPCGSLRRTDKNKGPGLAGAWIL